MRRLILALALAAMAAPALAAPALVATSPTCPKGLHSASTAELFFSDAGNADPDQAAEDWRSFLHDEVTPRFTAGVATDTVYAKADGDVFVRAPARAVFLVLTGTADERRNLDYVRDAWRRRFVDGSMQLIEGQACVAL
jgi:hypothetical protein